MKASAMRISYPSSSPGGREAARRGVRCGLIVMTGASPAMTKTARLQAPRDQHLHDLVGAGVDALHPRVAEHARDRVFVHIAIPAEQLQATVDDVALQVGEAVLGHRRCDGIELAR